MPDRLLFLLLLFATATALRAQIEWNPQLGRSFADARYTYSSDNAAGNFSATSRGGWLVGLDARIGGGAVFFVPGLQWQRLEYAVQTGIDPSGAPTLREGAVQLLRLPVGLAYRLRAAHTSFNLNLHAGAFYQLEVAQSELSGPDSGNRDWHPDSGLGARLGVGLDMDWLTLHLNYSPLLSRPAGFSGNGGPWPVTFSAGVRF